MRPGDFGRRTRHERSGQTLYLRFPVLFRRRSGPRLPAGDQPVLGLVPPVFPCTPPAPGFHGDDGLRNRVFHSAPVHLHLPDLARAGLHPLLGRQPGADRHGGFQAAGPGALFPSSHRPFLRRRRLPGPGGVHVRHQPGDHPDHRPGAPPADGGDQENGFDPGNLSISTGPAGPAGTDP